MRVAVVQQVLPPKRAGHRQTRGMHKAAQVGHRLRIPAAAAQHQQWLVRVLNQLHQRSHICSLRCAGRGCSGQCGARWLRHFFAQHIFGQGQYYRPHAPRKRGMKRPLHHFPHAFGVVDLRHPFADRAKHAAVVHFLKRAALHKASAHLPNKQDQRRAVLKRGMQPDGSLASAGCARHKTHAGLAAGFGIGLGHKRGRTFMAAHNQAYRVAVVVERVHGVQKAFARYAKHGVHALGEQGVNQQARACGVGEGRHTCRFLFGCCLRPAGPVHAVWWLLLWHRHTMIDSMQPMHQDGRLAQGAAFSPGRAASGLACRPWARVT